MQRNGAHFEGKFIVVLSRIWLDSMSCTDCRQVDGRIVVRHQQTIATIIHLQVTSASSSSSTLIIHHSLLIIIINTIIISYSSTTTTNIVTNINITKSRALFIPVQIYAQLLTRARSLGNKDNTKTHEATL